jgi:acyl-CoA synthetase (NDP forming)/RimJ/RimL family protein N-acetyltransferase
MSAPVDVALRDGATVRIRPVREGDAAGLATFLEGLSLDSRVYRFFTAGVNLARAAERMAELDDEGHRGLVAVAGEPERIVAHAAYVRMSGDRAEVAFEVADDWQGRGVATVLLAHLSELATAAGVRTFVATVLPENRRMIGVFRDSGFAVEVRATPGELQVELPAELGESARLRFEERDRSNAAAAVASVLRPQSVAVIGAASGPDSSGGAVLRKLAAAGYRGRLAAVDPSGGELEGIAVHASVADVPGPVELAVVAVPAESVPELARECGAAGVRALVVLSAGFAETGPEGAARQAELLTACRAAGMRLVGPNCLGALNTAPDVRLDATYAPQAAPAGRVALASQSGAFGNAAIAEAARRGIGLSSFVSMGNKADLSGNDFLQYWESDEGTDAVLLYLESFGNPRRFGRIARRVAAAKPIVAVKSGRSAGAREGSSHTGALLAGSDATVDALFRHAGVIRAGTVGEMFDAVGLLAGQPLPPGDRVGVVTNARGPGIACADACRAAGLQVPSLHAQHPAAVTLADPVGLSSSSPDEYRAAIEALADDGGADAVIAIFSPPLVTRAEDVAGAVRDAAERMRAAGKPLLAVWLGEDDRARAALAASTSGVPAYATPEEAVRALAHAAGYARWHASAHETPPTLDRIDADAAAAIVARSLAAGGGWLPADAVAELLDAYGIPQAAARVARSPTEAGRCAAQLGETVAVKAIAPGLIHKSDVGGVRLGVRGATAAARAAREVADAVREAGTAATGFLVQAMVPEGVEMLAGVAVDPDFGPVVVCAAGGIAIELIGDVQVRLPPLTARDAAEMVRELRTFPLLDGFRGAPVADVAALEDVLLRLSALAAAHPQITELDCNPVIVTPAGATVVDARVRVEAPPPPRPFPSLDR